MNKIKKKEYQFQKYWYLGFLGFIGIYELPEVWAYFQGEGTFWVLTDLLWLLWFFDFLPTKIKQNDKHDSDSIDDNSTLFGQS